MKLAAVLLVALLVGLVSARNMKRRELSEAEQKELMQNRGLLFGGLGGIGTGTGTGTGIDSLVTRWERFWSSLLTGRPFADTDNDGIIDKFDPNIGR